MPGDILVIEDNPANLELMTYLLRAFGHRPMAAETGEEALEMVQRQPPDLVICDIQLPGINGYKVARQLKSCPETRSIPLVAVTAYAMVGDREKMLAAGFDGYLAKPIVPETFVELVEGFLQPHQRTGRPSPATAAPPTPEPSRPSLPRRATILAVEDSLPNLEYLRSLLEPNGYGVLPAENVEDAIRIARERRPDLILSDVHLFKETGFRLLSLLKGDPELKRIPFVFLSATEQSSKKAAEGIGLGAVRFLVRPIEPQMLLDEIHNCLQEQALIDKAADPPDCS